MPATALPHQTAPSCTATHAGWNVLTILGQQAIVHVVWDTVQQVSGAVQQERRDISHSQAYTPTNTICVQPACNLDTAVQQRQYSSGRGLTEAGK